MSILGDNKNKAVVRTEPAVAQLVRQLMCKRRTPCLTLFVFSDKRVSTH
jgi:hypothetical protein